MSSKRRILNLHTSLTKDDDEDSPRDLFPTLSLATGLLNPSTYILLTLTCERIGNQNVTHTLILPILFKREFCVTFKEELNSVSINIVTHKLHL